MMYTACAVLYSKPNMSQKLVHTEQKLVLVKCACLNVAILCVFCVYGHRNERGKVC